MEKTALNQGTVRAFLEVLRHKLIRYDERQQKRRPNPYSLALLIQGLQKIKELPAIKGALDNDDEESLGKLKRAILKVYFPDFSPAKGTINAIDKFLSQGKLPRLRSASRPVIASQDDLPEFGEYVFWLLHHRTVDDKKNIARVERVLEKKGFRGWGRQVAQLPKAKVRYLELCRQHGIRPEAA